MEAYNLI